MHLRKDKAVRAYLKTSGVSERLSRPISRVNGICFYFSVNVRLKSTYVLPLINKQTGRHSGKQVGIQVHLACSEVGLFAEAETENSLEHSSLAVLSHTELSRDMCSASTD